MTTSPATDLSGLLHGETIKRDSDGRVTFGNPQRGCPSCGRVEMKYAQNGNAVLYHPGVECCAAAVTRQIAWRAQEAQRIFDARAVDNSALAALEAAAREAQGYKTRDANNAATRFRAGIQRRDEYVHAPRMRALAEEVRDLKALHAAMTEERTDG